MALLSWIGGVIHALPIVQRAIRIIYNVTNYKNTVKDKLLLLTYKRHWPLSHSSTLLEPSVTHYSICSMLVRHKKKACHCSGGFHQCTTQHISEAVLVTRDYTVGAPPGLPGASGTCCWWEKQRPKPAASVPWPGISRGKRTDAWTDGCTSDDWAAGRVDETQFNSLHPATRPRRATC